MTGGREEKGVWEQRARRGEEDPIKRLFPCDPGSQTPSLAPPGYARTVLEGGQAVQEVLPPPPALGSTALSAAVVPARSFLRS